MTQQEKIAALSQEIGQKQQELMQLRAASELEVVQDYTFKDRNGDDICLSTLFGDKQDLLVIHNMGEGCAYCTLWADGFVSLLPHIESRTSFVVVSPDAPEVQRAFAQSRGWSFTMVSAQASDFTKDMGFQTESHVLPGVTAFYKDDAGVIYRSNKDYFGPGDVYNAPWHLFSLLHGGEKDWQPKHRY